MANTLFQFTPLREGRQTRSGKFRAPPLISIHAPPRGATLKSAGTAQYLDLFQFTPLREGRHGTVRLFAMWTHFNSRPSARGDPEVFTVKPQDIKFQFTPLREGRRVEREGRKSQRYFNSRPSARGDASTSADTSDSAGFQFTPLREGRRAEILNGDKTEINFNSRPSARGDKGR